MNWLEAGAEPRKKLDSLEAEIADLKASIDGVRNENVSYDDLSKRLTDALSSEVHWRTPENDFNSFILAAGIAGPRAPEIDMARLCYIFGKVQIRDLILQRIKASPLKPGTPLADRPKKIAALQVRLRQAQIDAELERLRLEAAGHKILPGVHADPAILLELWAGLPAA